jgi:hypothetical protein
VRRAMVVGYVPWWLPLIGLVWLIKLMYGIVETFLRFVAEQGFDLLKHLCTLF